MITKPSPWILPLFLFALLFEQTSHLTAQSSGSVQFSASQYVAGEGYAGDLIRLTRTGANSESASVQLLIVGGTARNEEDFRISTNEVTFAVGQATASVRLTVLADGTPEKSETVELALANPGGGLQLGGQRNATLTIYDQPIRVSFEDDVVAPDEGQSGWIRRVIRSGNTNLPFVVDLVSKDGTAKAGRDYVSTTNRLQFAANETAKEFTFPLIDNSISGQPTRTFYVQLENPNPEIELRLPVKPFQVSIQEDDHGYALFPQDNCFQDNRPCATFLESDGVARMTVYRIGGYDIASTVDYYIVPGTAVPGQDYAPVSGTLTFPPGHGYVPAVLEIPLINNQKPDRDRTFTVYLTKPSHGIPFFADWSHTTVHIRDNELGYRLDRSVTHVAENAGELRVSVFRDGDFNISSSIDYAVTEDTAIPGVDFVPVFGTLTFGPGITKQEISIPILNNTISNINKSFVVTLSNPTAGVPLQTGSPRLFVIDDNDKGWRFEARTYGVTENSIAATLTVLRASDLPGELSVDYYTEPINAQPGADYTSTSGTIKFGPDDLRRTILIPVINNGMAEATESFRVVLTNASPGTVLASDNVAVVNIDDNDLGWRFFSPDYSFDESIGMAVLDVARPQDLPGILRIDYHTEPIIARAGTDYTPVSGTIEFGPSDYSRQIRIPIMNDGLVNPLRTFRVVLTNGSPGTTLGSPNRTTITIRDNETGYQAENADAAENSTEAVVTVRRLGDFNIASSVDYSTSPGTATPGADYMPTSGTLSFEPGESAKVIRVPLINDGLGEGDETFFINLTNPSSGVPIYQSQATVVIHDNDLGYQIAGQNLAREDSGWLTVFVNRLGDFDFASTVDYSILPGSATPALDYTPVSGTLTFAVGETRKEIRVPILNDSLAEGDETLLVALRNPSQGLQIQEPRTYTATIYDNDIGYHFDESERNPIEKDGEITINVIREGDFAFQSRVNYQITSKFDFNGQEFSGTAIPGTNFLTTAGTLWFDPGVTNQQIHVQLLDNKLFEWNKTFFVVLANASQGVPIQTAYREVLVEDNEQNPARVDPDFSPAQSPASRDLIRISPDSAVLLVCSRELTDGLPGQVLLRLLPNGTIDPGFHPTVFESEVTALAVDSGGSIFVAGIGGGNERFKVNDIPVNGIVRLKPNGTPDPSFQCDNPQNGIPLNFITIQENGALVAASSEGHPVVRLKPDGKVDPDFVVPSTLCGITRLISQTGGGLIVLGCLSDSTSGLFRLTSRGQIDTNFPALPPGGVVQDVVVLPDGRMMVLMSDDSNPVPRLVRLTANGKIDATFTSIDPGLFISSFDVTPDGKASMLQFLPDSASTYLLRRLNQDGTIDSSWLPAAIELDTAQLRGEFFGGGFPFWRRSQPPRLIGDRAGRLLLVGDFSTVNGRFRPGLARLDLLAPLPRIEIATSCARISETNGMIAITLVRAGDNSLPMTADYLTEGGSAREGRDYVRTSGVVSFAPGESRQTIPLQLIDNAEPDGDRTVRLRIRLPNGKELPVLEFTIVNDDPGFIPGGVTTPTAGVIRLVPTGHMIGGHSISIDYSDDLRTWQELTVLTRWTSVVHDHPPTRPASRFYRLRKSQ